MGQKIRLIIVDDQRLFAEGLQFVIESRAKDFKVVDIAENGREAIIKVREHQPDVVLMDVRMPVMDGVEATRIIHDKYPHVKILILTTFDDDEYVKYSMQNGAIGYLLKNRPPAEVIDSIRALAQGILQIDPAVAAKFLQINQSDEVDTSEFFDKLRTLTERERQVLKLLVDAKNTSQIADELNIVEQTVRNHTSNIYFKLGIHRRLEIVRLIDKIRFFLKHEN